jgi:hypothetical protein
MAKPPALLRLAALFEGDKLDEAQLGCTMDGKRSSQWTSEEDALFRRLVETRTDPEIIAARLDRSVHSLKTRAYAIGLPRKWFKPKLSLMPSRT